MKNVLALIAALGFSLFLFGQDTDMLPRSGYGVQDAAMIDKLMATMPGFGGARDMLQQQSVRPFLMPVRRVGERGEEAAYILSACLEYYVNRERNFKVNLSPDFIAIHLQRAGSNDLRDALTFLINRGTVSAAVVPYDAATISEAAFAVPTYQITNYLHIFRELSPARQRVFEVKKALLRGNPVIVELRADHNFKNAEGAQTIAPGAPEKVFTLLIVGFDEATGSFEMQACWGHDWGRNGYAFIRYDDFEKAALNGYVIVP